MYENMGLIILIVSIVIMALLLTGVVILIWRRGKRPLPMDELEGHDFEYYCADLLKKSGFSEASVTKGSGDFGADIIAEKDGVSYAIQCKCYDKPIGVKAVQEAYAGKDYYDCMVGVVMTNQYFTAPAVELARKLKIMLWDRGYVESMEKENGRE
jgi:restriction system protein